MASVTAPQRMVPGFPYTPLGDSEIRLVKIEPVKTSDILRCKMIQTTLDPQSLGFVALSYVWGWKSDLVSISLNSQPFSITRSLYRALRQFQQSDDWIVRRFIWIDAICINQDDIHEKAKQIPRMTQIYDLADAVVGWLGLNSPDVERDYEILFEKASAIAVYKREHYTSAEDPLGWLEGYDYVQHQGPSDDIIAKALIDLQSRSWFGRVWIVQEACIGRCHRILISGRLQVNLADLCLFYSVFKKHSRHSITLSAKPRLLSLGILVMEADNVREMKSDHWGTELSNILQFLLNVLLYSANTRSFQPHDRIYGMLGLAGLAGNTANLPVSLRPDYEIPFETVYHEYAKAFITNIGDLRFLSTYSRQMSGVPSWVPDFRFCTAEQGFCRKSTRAHAQLSSDGLVLTLEGVELGFCVSCLNSHFGKIERDSRLPWLVDRIASFEDHILRKLSDLKAISQCEARAMWLDHLRKSLPTSRTQVLYEYLRTTEGSEEELTELFSGDRTIETFQKVFRFQFFLISNGSIAAHNQKGTEVEAGDIVCVFKGACEPSAIRPAPNHTFRLVGQVTLLQGIEFRVGEDFFIGKELKNFSLG